MVFKNVQVIFTKQNAVFFPGENVDGNVSFFIHSSESVKVSEFCIKLNGMAKVSWRESDTNDDSTTYSSNEVYCKLKQDIIESENSTLLAPGEHSYKFSFHLPNNIAPTFKGNHGGVTYILKISIKRPWKLKHRYEFPINVDSKLTIEDFPELKIPQNLSLEKTYSMCCKYGMTCIDVTLPKTVYLCGQTVNINVILENNSNVAIKDIAFKIRKKIEFISSFPLTKKRTHMLTIGKAHSGSLPTKFSERQNYSIQIPHDIEIFDLRCCSIINFNYSLYVTVVFCGTSRSLIENIPLVITRE